MDAVGCAANIGPNAVVNFGVRCEKCFLFFVPVHIAVCFVCGVFVCLALGWLDVGCWVDEELHRDAVVLDFFAREDVHAEVIEGWNVRIWVVFFHPAACEISGL